MTSTTMTHLENISYSDGVRDFAIQLDENWTIPGGAYTQPISGVFTVEWGDIGANYPPQ